MIFLTNAAGMHMQMATPTLSDIEASLDQHPALARIHNVTSPLRHPPGYVGESSKWL